MDHRTASTCQGRLVADSCQGINAETVPLASKSTVDC